MKSHSRSPQLTPQQVATLPQGYADVPPRYAKPGMTLHALVCELSWDRQWLEAAVRGGYVPSIEGLALALRGLFLLWQSHWADHAPEDCPDTDSPCYDWPAFFHVFARWISDEVAGHERALSDPPKRTGSSWEDRDVE